MFQEQFVTEGFTLWYEDLVTCSYTSPLPYDDTIPLDLSNSTHTITYFYINSLFKKYNKLFVHS